MSEYKKPLPIPSFDSDPFWGYVKAHELRFQHCANCGHIWFPPSRVCPECLSMENEWLKSSGRGKVYSWTVYYQLYHPAFVDDIPYNVAVIEIEEGPRILANVRGCSNDSLYIGMPVQVRFHDATEDQSLYYFEPAAP